MDKNKYINKAIEIDHGGGQYDFIFNVTNIDDYCFYGEGIVSADSDQFDVYCSNDIDYNDSDIITVFDDPKDLTKRLFLRFSGAFNATWGMHLPM